LFRNLNIKVRILVYLILGIIFFSSALLYISKLSSQMLLEKYLYHYLEITQQEMGKDVELLIDEVNMITVRLLTSDNIYNVMSDSSLSNDRKKEELRKTLDSMAFNRQTIGNIAILTKEGEIFNYVSDNRLIQMPDNNFINQLVNATKPIIWGPIQKESDNDAYLLMGKKFRNFNTGQNLGYLIVYIRESALYDIYKGVTPYSGYSFLVSKSEYVISHPETKMVGSTLFESDMFNTTDQFTHFSARYKGEDSIFAISRFNDRLQRLYCDWEIVSVISQANLFEIVKKINQYVVIIGIAMSFLAVIMSIIISSQIVGPIRLLMDKLKSFGRDREIKLSFLKNTGNEIWELENSYNEMILRISDLINKNNEEKEKQRELELIALQAQINPHFLYNTLDAIGWIAKLKKQTDIERLVLALAQFFRISLHKGDKLITIQEEIDLVKNYATIEQIRFPEKFDVMFDVDEEILQCKIVKITLQPLVENAIKHGISVKGSKGHIMIRGRRIGDDLLLEVADDGVGFDVSIAFSAERKHSGYGLGNVDERLKLEYGEKYGIEIFSEEKKGTRVEVRLKAVLTECGHASFEKGLLKV
jgi:two-component system, sensor histidine kinase YesM